MAGGGVQLALARTYAMALAGVQGHVVEIEADIENGLPALFLVGLPDTALGSAGPDQVGDPQQSPVVAAAPGDCRSLVRQPAQAASTWR